MSTTRKRYAKEFKLEALQLWESSEKYPQGASHWPLILKATLV
ncbi:MAG: hypothetical protein AAF902_24545 [Chloroflexota bacterium]